MDALCEVLVNKLSRIIFSHSNDLRLSLLQNTNAQIIQEESKFILAEIEDAASDSGSDADSSEDELDRDDLDSVVDEIKIYTQCLVDLNAALECPATDHDHRDNEFSIPWSRERSVHEYYAALIIAKYPKANPDIAEALGKVNWDRYQRMQQERDSNLNKPTQLAESAFQDSGLGTSRPTQLSAYATTVMSEMSNVTDSKHIKVPPLSTEAKNGKAFECNACGKHIKAATNREWRKHLFNDLRPYTCFYAGCNFCARPFSGRQEWSIHLELDHSFGPEWESQQCPLCLESTGAGKSVNLVHFARHMEDIALSALPHDVDSEAESDAVSDADSDTVSHVEFDTELDIEPGSDLKSESIEKGNEIINTEISLDTEITVGSTTTSVVDTTRSAYTGPAQISDNVWELHRHEVNHLYLVEDRTVEDVIWTMAERHGLRPSKSQFERRLKLWDLRKRARKTVRENEARSTDNNTNKFEDSESLDDISVGAITGLEVSRCESPLKGPQASGENTLSSGSDFNAMESETSSHNDSGQSTAKWCNPSQPITVDVAPSPAPEVVECKCPVCDKSFQGLYSKGRLARHRRLKHDSSQIIYQCASTGCQRSFKRADVRLKHHRKHHPELRRGPACTRKRSIS